MAPRIRVSDLLIDMPCSLPVFLAQSPVECYQYVLGEARSSLPLLAELVEMYFNDHWGNPEQAFLTELTVLHHFILILG